MGKLQTRISAKQEQVDKVSATVTFFEEKIDAQDTLIKESEEAFKKVPPR
jgi:peptidoglycan hydrolase CwlO-like protein